MSDALKQARDALQAAADWMLKQSPCCAIKNVACHCSEDCSVVAVYKACRAAIARADAAQAAPVGYVNGSALQWLHNPDRGTNAHIQVGIFKTPGEACATPLYAAAPPAPAAQEPDEVTDAQVEKAWGRFEAEMDRHTKNKAERVHALVNAGPYAGMSEAFDAHMGAACWTDPAYRADAATWAAAWKAAQQEPAQAADEFAWLVELRMPGPAPQWLGFGGPSSKSLRWCHDANDAVRLARKADAEQLRRHYLATLGFLGNHAYEAQVTVTEHGWTAPPTTTPAPAAAQAKPAGGCAVIAQSLPDMMRHVRRLQRHVEEWMRWYGETDVLIRHQLPLPPAGTASLLEALDEAIAATRPDRSAT